MKQSSGCAALLLVFGLGLGGCEQRAETASRETAQKLVLTGSSTIAPLVAEIAKRFEQQNPGVRVDVQTGGSSRGIADARSGLANIGMVSRALKPDEGDLLAHPIARDGICLIVHASNPVAELAADQVATIYKGKIVNWRELGGRDAPITVVNKAEGRSTLELFLSHFKLNAEEVKASVVIGDNEQGVKTVAGNPDAIGYVSIGSAEYAAIHGVPLKLLPLGNVAPSTQAVRDGTFPLSRPLNLVTRRPPQALAQAFIEYAQSPAVRDGVESLYFVPVR
ncbi:MAG: phosphate ABC transporter substrate-binding protein [Gammaproteobacteria bacterium]